MAGARPNSTLIFAAVFVAAVIVVIAVMNRPGAKQKEDAAPPPEVSGPRLVGPELEPAPVEEDEVTHIDQAASLATPPEGPETAGAEAASELPTLLAAAERGEKDAVESLLASGEDPDQRGPAGRTALMVAAENGQLDALFALLNGGADPGLRDETRRSARDYALARYDEVGHTMARILEDAMGVVPVANPTDK